MNKLELTVTKATESDNGGFVVTLVNKSNEGTATTAFGEQPVSEHTQTYYMKLTAAPAIGFSAVIDLDDYDVVEYPFTTRDGKDIDLKWLHIKR